MESQRKFEFSTANRILFGEGSLQAIGPIAAENGTRAFVVRGTSEERTEPLLGLLDRVGVGHVSFPVAEEPTVYMVQAGVDLATEEKCDLVVGFGGGSVIDTAKAIAAMLTNPGDVMDYLEVIGGGKQIREASMSMIAIPTTAGTGSEVTRNSVLGSPEHKVKVSMRSAFLLPDVALVDPELTYSMPPQVTAYTGMDALTQCLEPLVSRFSNPLTDGICREGLQRAGLSLKAAYRDGGNRRARSDMSLASLFGGLALANAKLGSVHGLAGPLGGMIDAPHGAICACLLPAATAINIRTMSERQPDNPSLTRYKDAMQLLTGAATASLEDGLEWLSYLVEDLQIPGLRQLGFSESMIEEAVEKAEVSSSMKGNPIDLESSELREILSRSM